MTDLILIARSESRNECYARIAVFQNEAKAGVLTVRVEHEQGVLGAINAHHDLLEACKSALAHVEELREAWRTIEQQLQAAITKGE